ncbi:MAG: SURF1 family protein [Gammaproteobacteria bacterium]|nr:SURF1 family protein [Gammaproteobacteria bacterium]
MMNKDDNSETVVGETTANQSSGLRRIVSSTLILLPLLALFLWAGNWQLNRADEKRTFIDSFNDASQTPVLNTPIDIDFAESMLYRRFELHGRYLSDRQVLLDNMVADGEVGYQVLTPFKLSDELGGQTLVVNRGWVKGSADRLRLPAVAVGDKRRKIRGRLAFLPAPGIRLDAPLPEAGSFNWPLPMTWPTTGQIGELLGSPVLEWQLLLDADQNDGYRRDWQPETMGPETHLGYALQWFSFAAIALIIYVAFNIRGARKLRENSN